MDLEQCRWTPAGVWEPRAPGRLRDVQLALVFGGPAALKDRALCGQVAAAYPDAYLFGCSTAGDIFGTEVSDDSLVNAKQSLADAVDGLVGVLSSAELRESIGATDRANLAKYLTIAKLRLENAIALVRSDDAGY